MAGVSRTSAWPALDGRVAQVAVRAAPPTPRGASGATLAPDATLRRAIEAVCECLLAAEPTLTEMDQRVGDGDLGISLARGARAMQIELDSSACATGPDAVLRGLSATLRRVMGGTSGPLYAVMLLRAAAALEQSGGTMALQWDGVQRRCRWIDGAGGRGARRSHDGRCAETRRRRAARRAGSGGIDGCRVASRRRCGKRWRVAHRIDASAARAFELCRRSRAWSCRPRRACGRVVARGDSRRVGRLGAGGRYRERNGQARRH
ncbi:hypothetical protein OKW42_001804 [Paraburkholderia sp. WC7.3d]